MFKKVVFPTDFSTGTTRAIERFERENSVEVGECILLHVIDEGYLEDMLNGYSLMYDSERKEMSDIISAAEKDAMDRLKEVEERCRKMGNVKKIRKVIRTGLPHEEIVKLAEEEGASMILMPSHGKLGYSEELLGSTTMRVLRRSRRPVLIIKTHEEE